jgi:hypothetical protein
MPKILLGTCLKDFVEGEVDDHCSGTFVYGHLDLSGLGFGVASRMGGWIPKEMYLEEDGLRALNMVFVLGLMVNIIGGTYTLTT